MLNKSEFNQEIEKFVKNTGETYIDAVIHYAEKNGLEVETISKMLNKVIRQKIESEASDLNLLKEKLKLCNYFLKHLDHRHFGCSIYSFFQF